ncbi:HD family phosphohydrolase [Coleofasciculus sp. FACHB-SPT36]|uniref:HD family phosphohydrolase n=1 Tax=Cyanophyceae TaxID=3028117 RepID=UPI00168B5600|nr:HD family phosphohydrolase [Coleofasciculus sp. FACHB-SPT36]MBD2540398.1 GAF domain-containing protein [Coleofasciculus sp. FACHB-SPT36]
MTVSPCQIITAKNQVWLPEIKEPAELIEQLLAIGTALSSSHNLKELLNLILSKSREITCSDAGSVYLVERSSDTPKLVFKVAQNDSQCSDSFQEFLMPLTPKSLAGYVALTGESLNLPDAYNLPLEVPYQLDRSFDSSIPYHTRSVLVLPMQDGEGEIIGVLQLINRKVNRDGIVTPENVLNVTQPYSAWEERVVRSLASQAAISIERNQLQESIENLFEGFVRASVQIIETRDPTTSGHSERVADLVVRLSQEASTITTGSLRSIYFNERQIQEIRYAALLHDFGKVSTPEAILGKQKKLYPSQIEVIRNRFAVAQRTLEMECAQTKFKYLLEHPSHQHKDSEIVCSHCQQLQQLDSQLEDAIAQLNEYWHLLLEANEPHILAQELPERLQELSAYTYQDVDGQIKPLLSPTEIAQLMVPQGNLTTEERLIIQAHVTHTFEFLNRIPWTKHLKDVPAIAAGHHEKLDGSGYPQGLKQEAIPIQSQILTIADIYDALTASDRPYKRRLPVETALKILKAEAAQNKINSDLVTLFEQRQVFAALGHSLSVPAPSAA